MERAFPRCIGVSTLIKTKVTAEGFVLVEPLLYRDLLGAVGPPVELLSPLGRNLLPLARHLFGANAGAAPPDLGRTRPVEFWKREGVWNGS